MPSNVKLLAGASGGEPTDANFKNVTLLLHGDGSNGAQNNTFIDSSTNNFTITRNGNTTQGSFSPYGSNWSNYFDGSGDYLSGPTSSSFDFGTGDFTVEAWFFMSALPALNASSERVASISAYTGGTVTANQGWEFYVNATTNRLVFSSWGSSNKADCSFTVSLGTWYHVAATRSGGTTRLFVNGVSQTLTTNTLQTNNDTNANIRVGTSRGDSGYEHDFPGYLSNVRIVKGTAVYTSAFTPSTTPLTAITNTSLLTCADNRFRDGSTNNFTITRNGDVKVTNFAPFAPSSAYSTTTNGGSAYGDGSGDYLSLASDTALAFGTSDFTWECWWYPLTIGANDAIWRVNVTNGAQIGFDGAGNWGIAAANVAWIVTSSTKPAIGMWNHLAISRSGSNMSVFLNGVRLNTTASGGTNFVSGALTILSESGGSYACTSYISDVRLVKGTAVYDPTSTTYTVPSSPLSAVTNTNLLIKATNAAIFDNSMKNDLETVGNAQISTSVKKFGTGSMYFDGTGDNLICNTSTPDHFAFGSGDFTIEFWLYLNSTSGLQIIYDGRPAGTSSTTCPTIYTNGQSLRYYVNGADRITGANLNTSTWYHISVTRSGTSTKLFVDGTQSGSTYTDSVVYTNTASRPGIGFDANATNTNYLNGYLDELRVTKGIARYTANFTAPTAPFPNK